MVGFNLSVDFGLGWGDLERIARDDEFHRRAVNGAQRTLEVADLLEQARIPSTCAVVGGCCRASLDELQERAPRSFAAIWSGLERFQRSRGNYGRVLFCRPTVDPLARRKLIETGSHGFLHLIPTDLDAAVLQEDFAASVRVLPEACGREVLSFVPPQSYCWPREAFARTSIRHVRHSPIVYGRPYSGRGVLAKMLRLGNDVLRPTREVEAQGDKAARVFLRVDRGEAMWRIQLRTLEAAFKQTEGTVYCLTHPHYGHSSETLRRLADLCDLVQEYRERGMLRFQPFARNLAQQDRIDGA